jgi:DNA-3-methyladenine glycosylase I
MAYCDWGAVNAALKKYHDEEWGVPVHDDRKQFEFLMMEAMQCGLNWSLILQKREIFRTCFDDFDYDRVADYGEADVQRILETPGMIRSRRKIEAVIKNARCFREIRAEFGSFSAYIWAFSDGKTILYRGHEKGLIPAANGLSDRISRDLKARGFSYLGSVTVYSHLQACGIINDHCEGCPCRRRINAAFPTVSRQRLDEKDVRDFS